MQELHKARSSTGFTGFSSQNSTQAFSHTGTSHHVRQSKSPMISRTSKKNASWKFPTLPGAQRYNNPVVPQRPMTSSFSSNNISKNRFYQQLTDGSQIASKYQLSQFPPAPPSTTTPMTRTASTAKVQQIVERLFKTKIQAQQTTKKYQGVADQIQAEGRQALDTYDMIITLIPQFIRNLGCILPQRSKCKQSNFFIYLISSYKHSQSGLQHSYSASQRILQKKEVNEQTPSATVVQSKITPSGGIPPSWRNFKQFNTLGQNDAIITIEYCSNCQSHSKSTRHIPQKYHLFAKSLKQAILAAYPSIRVFLKPISSQQDESINPIPLKAAVLPGAKSAAQTVSTVIEDYRCQSRIGAFEVQMAIRFAGAPITRKIVFSKFRQKNWPNFYKVIEEIEDILPRCTVIVQLFEINGDEMGDDSSYVKDSDTVLGMIMNRANQRGDNSRLDVKFVRKSVSSSTKVLLQGDSEDQRKMLRDARPDYNDGEDNDDEKIRMSSQRDNQNRKFQGLKVQLHVDIGSVRSICNNLTQQLVKKGMFGDKFNAQMKPVVSAALALMQTKMEHQQSSADLNKSAIFTGRVTASAVQHNESVVSGRPQSASIKKKNFMQDQIANQFKKIRALNKSIQKLSNQSKQFSSIQNPLINHHQQSLKLIQSSLAKGTNHHQSSFSTLPGFSTARSRTPMNNSILTSSMRNQNIQVIPPSTMKKKIFQVTTNQKGQAIFNSVPVTKLMILMPQSDRYRSSEKVKIYRQLNRLSQVFSAIQQSARTRKPFFNIYLGIKPQVIAHIYVQVFSAHTYPHQPIGPSDTTLLVTAHLLYHSHSMIQASQQHTQLLQNYSFDFKRSITTANPNEFTARVPPGIYLFQISTPHIANKYQEFTQVVSLKPGQHHLKFTLEPFKKIPQAQFAAINCQNGRALKRASLLLTPCQLQAQTAISGLESGEFVHEGLSDATSGMFTFNLNESSVFKIKSERQGFLPMEKDFFLTKGNRYAMQDVIVPMFPLRLLNQIREVEGEQNGARVIFVLHADLNPQTFKLRIIPIEEEDIFRSAGKLRRGWGDQLSRKIPSSRSQSPNKSRSPSDDKKSSNKKKQKKQKKKQKQLQKERLEMEKREDESQLQTQLDQNARKTSQRNDVFIQENFRDIFGTWGFIKKSRFQQKWYRVVVQIQDNDIAKEIAKADFKRWDKHLSNGIQDTNLTFSIISTRGMHSSNIYPCPYIPPPQGGKHARFWDIGFINGNNSDFIEINAFRYNLPKKPEEHLHCLLLFLRFLHKRERVNFKKLFGFDVNSTFKFEDCYQKDVDFIQAFKRIGIKFRKQTTWSAQKAEKNVNAFLKHYTNSFKNSLGEVSLNKVTKQLSMYLSKQKRAMEGHVSQDENQLILTSYNGSPEVRKHITMNVIGPSPKGSIAHMSPQFSTNREDHDYMGIVSRHPTFGTLSSTPSSPVKRKY